MIILDTSVVTNAQKKLCFAVNHRAIPEVEIEAHLIPASTRAA
jgi:hypothetical protein